MKLLTSALKALSREKYKLVAGHYVETLGVIAISTMVVCYSLERFGRIYIALFAVGCAAAAVYAYLIESYPFTVAEGIWSLIAARRWYNAKRYHALRLQKR